MSRVAINTGSVANDGTGDSLRIAGGIINDNFVEIYNQFGDGSNLTPTWDKTAAGVNTTSSVGIGTTNPRFTLEVGAVGSSSTSLYVNGNARITGILTVGSSSIILDGNANKILVGSGISFDGNTGIISATAFYAGGSVITGGGGGGGDSYWVKGATGVTTTSNVGIATNSAPSALTVGGNSLFTGIATFRNNVTLSNITSSSNTLRFGSNSYIDQSTSDVLTFQINTGTDDSSTDGSFVFRTTEPNTSPIPDFQLDALRIYNRGNYWDGLVRVYTDLHVDNNAFVGGDLQVGAASTLIGVGSTLGSFKVGAGGTVITTTSTGLVGIGTTNPTSALTVKGNTSLETLSVSGVSTFNGNIRTNGSNIKLGDGNEAVGNQIKLGNGSGSPDAFGDSADLWIYHNSTYGNLLQDITGTGVEVWTGEFKIANPSNPSENVFYANVSAGTELYYDRNKKFETIGVGITVTGDIFTDQLTVSGVSTFSGDVIFGGTYGSNGAYWDESEGSLIFKDGRQARFGNYDDVSGGDLRIYHATDGSHSYIQDSGTGELRIISNGSAIRLGLDNIETYALFNNDGSVDLYYDNSKKFETTEVGVEVTGITITNQLSVSGVSTCISDVNVGVDTSSGVVLTSPNGTQYRLIVANDGTLSTTAV
jgi:hypothetical protein